MKSKTTITLFIKIVVLAGLISWALLIIKPFIAVLVWAIILAVAIYPIFQKMTGKTESKRKGLVSVLFTLIMVAVLAIPLYSMFSSVLATSSNAISQLEKGTLHITPPTEKVKDWPMGQTIYSNWLELSQNAKDYTITHKDFILEKGKGIFNSFLGIMGAWLGFIFSFIVAVAFMYNADGGHSTSVKFANKLIGKKEGENIVTMSRNTIRSVVKGILLVAIIQALLSFVGFNLIGLPAAGLFALLVMMSAIIQIPVTLTVIPTIILAFSISDNTTHTIIFTVYILAISLLDNFLKPILLSKGLQTPTIIIFIGAIGGVMLHGIIGLFLGTVVLALVHRFYMHWVNTEEKGFSKDA